MTDTGDLLNLRLWLMLAVVDAAPAARARRGAAERELAGVGPREQ
jgi:hypothetical protein